jgi:hypothetical protein
VHAAVVLAKEVLGNVRKQSEVDVIGDEGGERGKSTAESKENFEQSVESVLCVV